MEEEVKLNKKHFRDMAVNLAERVNELEIETAELKAQNTTLSQNLDDAMSVENALKQRIEEQKTENEQLKKELEQWKSEWHEQVIKANDEGFARTLQTIQLEKSKELLKKFMKIREENSRQFDEEVYFEAKEFLEEVNDGKRTL